MTSQGVINGENRDIVSSFAPVSRDFSHARDEIEDEEKKEASTSSQTG